MYFSGLVINILGLNAESQKDLCQQICKQNCKAVQQYLTRQPLIAASCYVPAKCIIILSVISKILMTTSNDPVDHNIRSLTHIFVRALCYYTESCHVQKMGEQWVPMELLKLSSLAWNGFCQKKIIFTTEDLGQVKISSETLEAFLTTSMKKDDLQLSLLQGKKLSSFSHLIWQELFTAIHILLQLPLDQFEPVLEQFLQSRWEIVALFAFGLCNHKVRTILADTFKQPFDKFVVKLRLLMKLAAASMANVVEDGVFHTSKFIQVCSWLHEVNDKEITVKVADCIPESIHFDGNVYLTDLSSVGYVLREMRRTFSVTFAERTTFPHDGLYRWLTEVSCTSDQKFRKILVKASLHLAKIMTADILLQVCRWLFQINDKAMIMEIAEAFPSPIVLTKPPSFKNIQHLMHFIVLSTKWIEVHFKDYSLPTFEVNDLRDSNEACTLFAFLSIVVQKPWQLEVKGQTFASPVTNEEFVQLMEHVIRSSSKFPFHHEINKKILDLSCCGISDRGMEAIAYCLLRTASKMKRLVLCSNWIRDKGAVSISKNLHNIEKLNISSCSITSVGVEAIAEKVATFSKPMKILDLSCNAFGDKGAMALASCLHNIQQLYIGSCNMTTKGMRVIGERLLTLSEKKSHVFYCRCWRWDDDAK